MSDSPVKVTDVTIGSKKVENKEADYTPVSVKELWSEIEGSRSGTPLFLDNWIGTAKADEHPISFNITSGLDGSIHLLMKEDGKPNRFFEVSTRSVIAAVLAKVVEEKDTPYREATLWDPTTSREYRVLTREPYPLPMEKKRSL